MSDPHGFTWERRKSGDVVIHHHGRIATTIRGAKADDAASRLLSDPSGEQHLLARLTGNYKRGNERPTKPRPASP